MADEGVADARVPAALLASARTLWTRGRRLERTGYLIGVALLVSGLVHLGVFAVDGGPWEGPVSWRKAVTFGVSFGLTVLTVVAVSSFLELTDRTRALLVGGFVAACVVEVALVTMQAWRHVPSHFNRDTGLDSAISTVLAAGGAVIVVVSVGLTICAWRARPRAADSGVWAIRAGLALLLVAFAVGVAMIAKGVVLAATVSPRAAYEQAGSLKPAHAVPMHAILVLPVIAWLLSMHHRPERHRVRLVGLAAAGYALTAGVVIVETVLPVDPLAPPPVLGTLSVLGLATVTGVGLFALAGLPWRAARRQPSTVADSGGPGSATGVRITGGAADRAASGSRGARRE